MNKYKDTIIEGSTFPDAPIRNDLKIRFTSEMLSDYLPTIESMKLSRGLRLLCTVMAVKEGFYKGSRSYRTNNPGNIGNVDSGRNRQNTTLKDGILLQVKYINDIVTGKHSAYPMGKRKLIRPYYSKEIARNPRNYGMSPYLPGYRFIFTGRLDQFVKIYSTGARAGNGYLNLILSYFKMNGILLDADSKIQDIIKLK